MFEKGAGDNDLKHRHGARQNHCPPSVEQMQIFDYEIEGDKPSLEHHRDHKKHHDDIAAVERFWRWDRPA